jgi:hypothetical protein
MEHETQPPLNPSRRQFAGTLAAALSFAPLALVLSGCERGPDQQVAQQHTPTPSTTPVAKPEEPPYMTVCEQPVNPLDTHIPPVIIGEGSLTLQSEDELVDTPEATGHAAGNPRKWRYTLKTPLDKYGNIYSLQPLIERQNAWDSRTTYYLANHENALRVWLQEWGGAVWNQAPDMNSEPHVLVKGNAASGTPGYQNLILEMDDKFSKKFGKSHKKNRPHKQTRQYGANDDQFRIYGWALVDADGDTIKGKDGTLFKGNLDDGPDYVGFSFMIRFYD